MTENGTNKQQFDPYTGEPIIEPKSNPEFIESKNNKENETYEYHKYEGPNLNNTSYSDSNYHNSNYNPSFSPVPVDTKQEKAENLATVSLILGVLSLISAISCVLTIFSIPLAIASIVCGLLSGKPRDSRNKKRFVGFLMSIISIVITVLLFIALLFVTSGICILNEYYEEDFYSDEYDDDYDYDDDTPDSLEDFFEYFNNNRNHNSSDNKTI